MKTEHKIDLDMTASELKDACGKTREARVALQRASASYAAASAEFATLVEQRDTLLSALQEARQGYCDAAKESTNPDEVEWAQGYLDDIDAVLIKFGIAQEGGAA